MGGDHPHNAYTIRGRNVSPNYRQALSTLPASYGQISHGHTVKRVNQTCGRYSGAIFFLRRVSLQIFSGQSWRCPHVIGALGDRLNPLGEHFQRRLQLAEGEEHTF